MKAVIRREELSGASRVFAVSDIHGNLDYLTGLLGLIDLTPRDVLVICGDMVDKGPRSLDTLRYIMELSKRRRVLCVCGNCDDWHRFVDEPSEPMYEAVRRYLMRGSIWHPGLLAQMAAGVGVTVDERTDMAELRRRVEIAYAPEFDFLRSLPQVIETERFTFVHGGLPEGEPDSWDAWECMKYDRFLEKAPPQRKWLIVGHWPVMLYGGDIVCANPIIDREKRIASIDGGCSISQEGQLNALILPQEGENFDFVAYDGYPRRRARDAQSASDRCIYVRYNDNEVDIISKGAEFTRCRHRSRGYELDVLTDSVYEKDGRSYCGECTDYALPVAPGDELAIVRATSRGYLAKRRGVFGWYYGGLD